MAKRQFKAKEPQTYDEFLAREWEQWRVHHTDDHCPSVNYAYHVGEQVSYGSLHDCVVKEVLEGGKILHITFRDKGFSYGQPYDNGDKPRLCWWYDADPVDTVLPTTFSRPRTQTQYIQTSLDSLTHMCYRRGLIDSPDYQRGYVWTLEDKQRLVKSIFDRCDIGKFVMMEYPYPENRYEIIDGKQRLGAIREFIEGRFAYEGYTWFQLSWTDKRAFFDIMIQMATLQANQVKKSDVLWLFLSLNRGGVPQTDEHIAKAELLYRQALREEENV